MTTLSPAETAFEGFRLSREQPRTLLIWAGLSLIVNSAISYVMIAAGWGVELMKFEEKNQQATPDPSEALAGLQTLGPLYLCLLAIGLIVGSVFTCAVYRTVLRPDDRAFGHLRLGGDELRQMVLLVVFFFLSMVVTFGVVLAAGLIIGLISLLIGSMAVLAGLAVGVFAAGLLVFAAVRLSLAGPQTFAERRLSVFGSWELTRGNFWRLLGSYLLSVVLTIVVLLLGLVIFAAVAAVTTGGNLVAVGAIFQPDMTRVEAYFTPARLLYLPFGGLFAAIQYALIIAPAAAAYRTLKGGAVLAPQPLSSLA